MSRSLVENLEPRVLLSTTAGVASSIAPWASTGAVTTDATVMPSVAAQAAIATRSPRASFSKITRYGNGDPRTTALAASDVEQILASAGSQAMPTQAVAVVDRDADLLGVYLGSGLNPANVSSPGTIEYGIVVRAIQRARTAAYFQSQGEAFTTRTARFIIQNHFPPGVRNTAGGPLYGVEFSSLPGSDVILPQEATGISGDPGGEPLFIKGIPVGGVGVAGDFKDVAPAESLLPLTFVAGDAYGKLANPTGKAFDVGRIAGKELPDFDESVAMAGSKGYNASPAIRATQIFIAGLRLPFNASHRATGQPNSTLTQLESTGAHLSAFPALGLPTATPVAGEPERVNGSVDGVPGLFRITNNAGAVDPATGLPDPSHPRTDPQDSDPVIDSNDTDANGNLLPADQRLTAQDVMQAMTDAVHQALITRAGIRKPNGSHAVLHVAITDRDGTVLGVFRMNDGTNFSYDIAVQKARTATYFSDDTHAFSARAIGFMSQKFFPPGIERGGVGPLFGLQNVLSDPSVMQKGPLHDGITIFPGGEPLYKNGVLVGGIGVSGDGVDQDDLMSYAGTLHFRPPSTAKRSDQLDSQQASDFVLGKVQNLITTLQAIPDLNFDPTTAQALVDQARQRLPRELAKVQLPYVKFPRNPIV